LRARAAELLQTAKKDKERRFVEILAKELAAFPPSKLIDSESPDFLVATSKGVLGIEATKIHHANEPRQQESECRSLVDAACRLYENESTIPLEVKVHFGGSTQFNQRNRGKFASILANLVLTNIPRPDSWISLENNWENPSFFPYEIAGLSIIRLSAFRRNFWSVPSAGFFQADFAPKIEAIIATKEHAIRTYKTDCIERWLLIVAEGNSASIFFDPSTKTLQHSYRSCFDRIFFLEAFRRQVWELNVSPHPS
jgi:hypothetical protein